MSYKRHFDHRLLEKLQQEGRDPQNPELFIPEGPATLKRRVNLLIGCQASTEFRERVKARCAEDPVFFLDYFAVLYDPEEYGQASIKPMLLWPFQRDLVLSIMEHIEKGKDLIIEKSRKVGASWLVIGVVLHQWLFRDRFAALLGSRKEDLVDNGHPDSLFGKLVFLLEHLPGWLLPKGWDPKRYRRFMKLYNPQNRSIVLGESSNPNFSRGGRFSLIVLDEAAFFPDFESVWRATSQSAPCRLLISTPNGRNAFARLRFSGQVDVITLHWSLVPGRDQEWYEREKARLVDPVTIAQELDISYDRSLAGLVYPDWQEVPKGHYPYQPGWPLYAAIDFGINDPTAIVWAQRNPETGQVRIIDYYENRGKPITFYVPFLLGEIPEECRDFSYSEAEREKIAQHLTWGIPTVFGDPAGRQRSQVTGESVLDVLRRFGIFVVTRPEAQDFQTRYVKTQLLIRKIEGVHLPDCSQLDMAIAAARFPEVPPDTRSTAERNRPIHDWTAHARSALEYLAVNLPEGRPRRPVVRRKDQAPYRIFLA